MEKRSSIDIPPFPPIPGFVYVILLRIIFSWVNSVHFFLSRIWSSIQTQIGFFGNLKVQSGKQSQDLVFSSPRISFEVDAADDGKLARQDVEEIMGLMGIFLNPEDEKIQERLGSDDVLNLFEEKEPSLEEVKEAFYVFDQNRDGFIDARDLQRVLCVLGLKEGSELEQCKKMIRSFDEDGDGRIDFKEFVKFMENSFC